MKIYITPEEMNEVIIDMAESGYYSKPKTVEEFQNDFINNLDCYDGGCSISEHLADCDKFFIEVGSRQIPPKKYIRENFTELKKIFDDNYYGSDDDDEEDEECDEEDEE